MSQVHQVLVAFNLPRPSHDTVDSNNASSVEGLVHEICGAREETGNVGRRVVVNVEAEVVDVVEWILCGADLKMKRKANMRRS